MSAHATIKAPTGRTKLAQGKDPSLRSETKADTLGHDSPNVSSPEGAGELPNDWRMARVGDILKVRNGYAFKSTDYRPEGVPLIRQSDLGEEVVDITDAKRVDPRFLNELPAFVVRDGDLLIGMSGSLGKIARYQHPEPALQNQRTGLLQMKQGHEPKFAKLVLKLVEPQILAEGKGIAVQNVSASEIENCTFPLPSPEEQRRIVAEIEKQFTRLEAGVAALRRVQANLKRYRAAVLKAACEGQLVLTEAELSRSQPSTKNSQPACETGEQLLKRILAERRKHWTGRGQYKEPSAPDTANLPPLPEGWAVAAVGHILRVKNGFAFKSSDYCESGIPLIRQADLAGRLVSISEAKRLPERFLEERPEFTVRKGDLLIGMSGALGKISEYAEEFPALQNQRTGLLLIDKGIPPTFAKLVLHYVERQIVSEGKGIAVQNVSASEIEGCVFMLPPLAEQTRIVAEVERRLSVVDELELVVWANLQRATRLRQSILQQAFTGKL